MKRLSSVKTHFISFLISFPVRAPLTAVAAAVATAVTAFAVGVGAVGGAPAFADSMADSMKDKIALPLRPVVWAIGGRLTSLDPLAVADVESYDATGLVIEPLTRLDPWTGKLIPWLAESWTMEQKKKVLRVTLRPYVRFHDGTLLSAADAKFTFDLFRAPSGLSGTEAADARDKAGDGVGIGAAQWLGMWAEVESAQVIGDRVVEFHLRKLKYSAYVNLLTALRILPRSFYASGGANGSGGRKRWRTEIVGTGPFRLKEFVPDQRLILTPFGEWWGRRQISGGGGLAHAMKGKVATVANVEDQGPGAGEFDLEIKSVTAFDMTASLFAKGEIDFAALPSAVSSAAAGSPANSTEPAVRGLPRNRRGGAQSLRSPQGEGLWLDLNLRRPIFKDQRVRQALLYLWDRRKINERLFARKFELASDSFSPQTPFYPPSPHPFAHGAANLSKAKELLAQAGWSDQNHDSVLEKAFVIEDRERDHEGRESHEGESGEGLGGRASDDNSRRVGLRQDLSFTVLVGSAAAERWVTLYQQDAAKAGVRVKIRRVEENGQFFKMLQEGKFDAVAGQGGLNVGVDALSWMTGAPYNFSGYSNPAVDKILANLEVEFDQERRQASQRKLIEIIRSDWPQVPGLRSSQESFLISGRLQVDPVYPRRVWRWRVRK